MDNQPHKVILNMYDLSQGMAKQFSPIFLGKQIDAIWHTGIVVYGKEYYFGGGICAGSPKQTIYGFPVEEKDLGETHIPQSTFEEFLRSISDKYTMDKYDLFKNNCNNFTNECSQFLVGCDIPEHIIGLPQEFLNTQLGQMMKPIIEQITNRATTDQQSEHFNSIAQPQPSPAQTLTAQQQQEILATVQNVLQNNQQQQGQQQQQQNAPDSNVIPIEDLETLICIIDSSPKCVIDFYTDWCGPCKQIKPHFIKLSNENPDIQFFQVNIDKSRDIAQQLGVTSIPTFMIYENGQQKERWSGGNLQQLLQKVGALKA